MGVQLKQVDSPYYMKKELARTKHKKSPPPPQKNITWVFVRLLMQNDHIIN